MTRVPFIVVTVVSVLCTSGIALAQTAPPAPPHVPLQKTIGGVTKPEVVPSLIVLNAQGVSLQGNKLVLTGVAPNSIVFADRPVRAAGHDTTSHIIEDWATGTDNFAKDPPNATVSAFSKDGTAIRDAVVVLKTPKLEGDRLTFDVDVLEGNLTGADGAAAIFIDIIGRPFTPLSFAGVARRTAFRGAMYRGAAYGAAAYGAAAAGVAAANARHSARYTGRRPAGTIRIRLATDVRGLGRLANRKELFNVEVIFDRDGTRAVRRAWQRLPMPSHGPHGHKQAC